eukprot:GHVS01081496.1.p1 GENE.GHVS01081496.1~~GHVS01081496.1.p1  ORF type:complete len:190 (+),score=6.58 GHVS01081496.1:340-909(+)
MCTCILHMCTRIYTVHVHTYIYCTRAEVESACEHAMTCRCACALFHILSFHHHMTMAMIFQRKQKEGDFDVVSGSRYISGGGVYGWDVRRVVMSRVANFMAQLLLNPRASDLTGSFRMYKRSVLSQVMPKIISKGYVFQMEVLVRCRALGFSIAEVPIQFVDRLYGQSKLGTGEVSQYFVGLLKLFWSL